MMTLCNQRRFLTAIYNVQEEPSEQNWQALLNAAETLNKLVVEELTELRDELTEMTASAMRLSLPLDDDERGLVTDRLLELNNKIERNAQSFTELNAIRLDAEYEAEMARLALAAFEDENMKSNKQKRLSDNEMHEVLLRNAKLLISERFRASAPEIVDEKKPDKE